MAYEYDFQARMADSKAAALARRNRGLSERKDHWAKPLPEEDTEENRLRAELANVRRELRERENDIAVLKNGDNPDDFGAEFDRLVSSARESCSPPARPADSRAAVRKTGRKSMPTERTYKPSEHNLLRLTALKLLENGLCCPAEAAELAGVSRQVVNGWIRGIDWRKAREKYLTERWKQHSKP